MSDSNGRLPEPLDSQGFGLANEEKQIREAINTEKIVANGTNNENIGAETAKRHGPNAPTVPPSEQCSAQGTVKGKSHANDDIIVIIPSDTDAIPNPKELRSDIGRLLGHCERVALESIQNLLDIVDADTGMSPCEKLSKMLGAVKLLADLRLTHEWTSKLQQAIKKNPANLLPPNGAVNPILNHLKTYATKTKQAGKRDKREGINKPNHMQDIDMPSDEDSDDSE